MASRVRKRSLGGPSQDPVGGGPKREIQITEHTCSKSAVYPLWTRCSTHLRLHPLAERPSSIRGGPFCISGENFARPRDGVLDATTKAAVVLPTVQGFRGGCRSEHRCGDAPFHLG